MKPPRIIAELRRSKVGKREMAKRLRALERAVGAWVGTLTDGGKHPADTDALSPELREVLRAHDACDWVAIEEDTAPEDGS